MDPVTRGLLEITGTKTPYLVQYLVSGSDFLSIHRLTFDKHDQLYVGSVFGQAIYALDIRSGRITGTPMILKQVSVCFPPAY